MRFLTSSYENAKIKMSTKYRFEKREGFLETHFIQKSLVVKALYIKTTKFFTEEKGTPRVG